MTEYEMKRRFVENDLAQLLGSIDPRIICVEYTAGEITETVYVRIANGSEYVVNVTGDSTLCIAIDVMTAIFGRDTDETKQQELRRRVNHIESACAQLTESVCAQLTESATKLIGEIADVTTDILQSTAQMDEDAEDKPDEA